MQSTTKGCPRQEEEEEDGRNRLADTESDTSATHSHFGEAPHTKNQDVIEEDIQNNSDRNDLQCAAGFSEDTENGVADDQGEQRWNRKHRPAEVSNAFIKA